MRVAMKSTYSLLCAVALVGFDIPVAQAANPSPGVRPNGAALEVRPPFGFEKKKTRRSVSGVACSPNHAGQRCLVVFDEGTKAQFAQLGAKRLEPVGTPFELTATDGELDAEGAALAGGLYYVTGSHSVKRESCAVNPASRTLIRFGSSPNGSPLNLVRTTRLWDLMRDEPYLKLHMEGCLGEGAGGTSEQLQRRPGINIEGIAVAGDRLYVGFRAPSEAGIAPVYSVDAKALFDGGDAKPRLERLSLGAHLGIRDMATARESILLLIGPDDFEAGAAAAWHVAEWKPGAAPRKLATLDVRKEDIGDTCFEALKPEALAILDESATRFRVLVMSDGVCDGGPMIFDLPR